MIKHCVLVYSEHPSVFKAVNTNWVARVQYLICGSLSKAFELLMGFDQQGFIWCVLGSLKRWMKADVLNVSPLSKQTLSTV